MRIRSGPLAEPQPYGCWQHKEGNMEVTIYKPDFAKRYGKRLTPSNVLEYVKQEYPVDENLTERDIEIHDEGDYARVIIERD